MKGLKQLDKRKNSHVLQLSFPLCTADMTETKAGKVLPAVGESLTAVR